MQHFTSTIHQDYCSAEQITCTLWLYY